MGLIPFPDAISLFEYWRDFPPPFESLRALLSAFTDWKPSGRSDSPGSKVTEEKRDLGGLALEIRTRTLGANALPNYMKDALTKDFGLSFNKN